MAQEAEVPPSFSQEAAGSQVVPLGAGKWWGRLLVPNTGADASKSLERYVRAHRNMRLRDRTLGRGLKAKREQAKEPKEYPLHKGDWSSCDESSDDGGSFHGSCDQGILSLSCSETSAL